MACSGAARRTRRRLVSRRSQDLRERRLEALEDTDRDGQEQEAADEQDASERPVREPGATPSVP